jgi:hypothetical protein
VENICLGTPPDVWNCEEQDQTFPREIGQQLSSHFNTDIVLSPALPTNGAQALICISPKVGVDLSSEYPN